MRLTGSRSKTVLVGDVDAVVVDDEIGRAGNLAVAAGGQAEEAVEHRRRLAVMLLERGAEDARQVADVLGDQEVVLHEALDVLEAGMGGVAEAAGHLALEVEGQALLLAAGEEMQVAAHRPEEILGLAEEPHLAAREDAGLDQVVARADAVEILGDPEQRLEVAQAALAFLDVGLDQIAGGALLAVALVALGELGGDEFRAGVLGDLGVEAGDQRVVERPVAA